MLEGSTSASDAESGPHGEDHPTQCLKHFQAVSPPGYSDPKHLPQELPLYITE